jgi:hypothetical protein
MKSKEEIIGKFYNLSNYNVKKGVINEDTNTENEMPPDLKAELGDTGTSGNTTTVVDKPIEFEAPEAKEIENQEKEETTKELADKSDIDRVKEIQDLQTQKIAELENFLNSLDSKVSDVEVKVDELPNIEARLDKMNDAIIEILPPSPEQQLKDMGNISSQITIEDFWNDFNKDHITKQNYIQSQITPEEKEEAERLALEKKKEDEMKNVISKVLSLPDSAVKDSLNKY